MDQKDSAEAMTGESFAYDAFASYATDPDGELVRAVEGLIESFHRRPDVPKDLIQELELCVDGRDFTFPPSRPETEPSSAIEQVIRGYQRQCRALIVFCGPAAKDHRWIGREIEWWGHERPDGPIYFAYTHGTYPDPKMAAEHMPASLIVRGGPSNPSYFDLRGYHRDRGAIRFILSRSLRLARAFAATIDAGFGAFMRRFFRWPMQARTRKPPFRKLGDVGDWKSVRPLDEQVCRIAAQLVSDKTGQALAVTHLTERYLAAEHEARRRRRRGAIIISVLGALALVAAWIMWDRLERQRRIVALADEAQTQIDGQQFEEAMRPALEGLPAKDDVFWAPGWADRDVQVLQAKLAGAANLSAFKTLIRKDEIPKCERLTSATYSRDGRWILTASECGVASVWDAKSMESIATCRQSELVLPADRKNVRHKEKWIRDTQFSRDGKRVVSVGPNGMAWIWSPSDGGCKHSIFLSGHDDDVRTGSFSADGRFVVTTSDDDTVRIWNAATGRQVSQAAFPGRSEPPEDYTTSAEFSPDDKNLVVTRSDGFIGIADTQTFADAQTFSVVTLRDKGPFVWRARFSSDGKEIVTALNDGSALIWDIAQRTPRSLPKQFLPIFDASFSPDGRLIVTASKDHTARIWDVATLEQRFVFMGHTDDVTRVEFSPDGKDILSSSNDGTARIWDAVTNVDQFNIKAHDRSVYSSALSQDGNHLVTSSKDGTVILWGLSNNHELSQLWKFDRGHEYVTSVSFDPEGRRIALAYSTGRASIIGISGDHVRDLASIRKAGNLSLAFSLVGNEVVIGSDEGNNSGVWNISTGEYKQLRGARRIRSVDIDPSGTRVAMGSDNGGAGIWDTTTGVKLHSLDHAGSVRSVHFSSDGAYLVTASTDSTARIWDSSTGSPVQQFIGHDGDVNDARFSRDGTRVVTASGDHTVRIWDLKTGTQMIRFEMASTVWQAMFTADGSHVVATSDDGHIEVFDVSWTMGRSDLAKRVCAEKLKGIGKFPVPIGRVSAVLRETNNLDPCERSFVERPSDRTGLPELR
jgi:WD40 repeat protein